MMRLRPDLGKPDSFSTAAKAVERSFVRFVRADGQGLYDVIDGPNGPDASVRPNQNAGQLSAHREPTSLLSVLRRQTYARVPDGIGEDDDT